MKAHLKYLNYIIRHKWFVFVAGLKTKAPLWRLLIHDWSKFRPSEWGPYVEYFYGSKPDPTEDELINLLRELTRDGCEANFNVAWNHHQKRNPHHWQYWLLIEDSGSVNSKRYGIQSHGDGYPCWIADFEQDSKMVSPSCPDIVSLSAEDNKHVNEHDGEHPCAKLQRLHDTLNSAVFPKPIYMPKKFVREMVADWAGAGRAITGGWDVNKWYASNKHKIILHPATRQHVEKLLLLFD